MGGGHLEEAGGAGGEGERAEEEEVAVDERLQRQVREVLEQQVDPKQRHRRRDGRQEALHPAACVSSQLASGWQLAGSPEEVAMVSVSAHNSPRSDATQGSVSDTACYSEVTLSEIMPPPGGDLVAIQWYGSLQTSMAVVQGLPADGSRLQLQRLWPTDGRH